MARLAGVLGIGGAAVLLAIPFIASADPGDTVDLDTVVDEADADPDLVPEPDEPSGDEGVDALSVEPEPEEAVDDERDGDDARPDGAGPPWYDGAPHTGEGPPPWSNGRGERGERGKPAWAGRDGEDRPDRAGPPWYDGDEAWSPGDGQPPWAGGPGHGGPPPWADRAED